MSLTPEMIADGWKPWKAGPWSGRLRDKPGIMRRNGTVTEPGARSVRDTNALDWYHESCMSPATDIIAYKPESLSHDQ